MIIFGSPIPYDIRITGSSNKGFIVAVGCATLTFTDTEEMIHAIREYIQDPEGVEKAYNNSKQSNDVIEDTSNRQYHTHSHTPMNEECSPDSECRR